MRLLAFLGNSKFKALFEMRSLSNAPKIPKSEYAWFHCASLGEYEQTLPVIEEYVKSNPSTPILLSFFSPSGYNPTVKNLQSWHREQDQICALPFDTPNRVRKFLEGVEYKIKFFVTCKYEVWPELLKQLQEASIRTCLFSAHLPADSAILRRSLVGDYLRWSWSKFSTILTQDDKTVERLEGFGIQSQAFGDPRVDRVLQLAQEFTPQEELSNWKGNAKLVVAGSTWRPEELSLTTLPWSDSHRLLIAPHDVSSKNIQEILSLFNATSPTASLLSEGRFDSPVIIADSMGQLSSFYHLADLAVVGGGYGSGIHSILEPAAHGIRVITGPNIGRFRESEALKFDGVLTVVPEKNKLATEIWYAISMEKPLSNWLESQKGCAIKIASTLP